MTVCPNPCPLRVLWTNSAQIGSHEFGNVIYCRGGLTLNHFVILKETGDIILIPF